MTKFQGWILVILVLASCAHQAPKNAVFLIVDGMGPAHITAARLYNDGPDTPLHLESLSTVGIARTHSTSDFVTDSASSATALASGVKTYNHAIGLTDPHQTSSGESEKIVTLIDLTEQKGMRTGLITNTSITHATPAAFYAHVPHRRMEFEIAEQLASRNIDLILGGGLDFFLPKGEGGLRTDGRNLLKEMEDRGYLVITSYKKLASLRPENIEQKVIALLDQNHLSYESDRKEEELSFAELMDFSLRYLRARGRFFLAAESGRVDHASHRNQIRRTLDEMLAMDKSVERILKETRDTLFVLTSDHETGGLALSGYAPHQFASGENLFKNYQRDYSNPNSRHGFVSWASGPGYGRPLVVDESDPHPVHPAVYPARMAYHTAVDVPVLAHGPKSKKFGGFMDNTEIAKRLMKSLRLK